MFFKNKIKKNIKLAVVLVLAVIVLTGGALSTFAAQEDPLSLGANGFELQSSSDTWTPINDGGQSLPPRPFVTSQLEKGTTVFGALTPSNYAYSKRSSGLESPSGNYGLYAISTGKLDSGYSYTVVYDKYKFSNSTSEDFIREVRVKDPQGKESVYIYTAKNGVGGTIKDGVLDKSLISKIGAANGDTNLYEQINNADSSTHKQDVINQINNSSLTDTQKTFLVNKVQSNTPLTAAEIDLYKARVAYDDIEITNTGFVTTVEKSAAVAAALAEDAEALKAAQNLKSAIFLKNKNDGQCFGSQGNAPYFFVDIFNCISQIFYYALTVATMALSLVGKAFNEVFDITVVNMKPFVDSVGIITVGWVAIRDMANILFIFMLLYLAIATILQLDEHGVKHGLSRLIIGAVLINFSLFFVKVPVDISNILAIEIYQKINPSSAGGNLKMGDAILSSLNFQNVYGAQTSASSWGSDTIASAQAFAQTNAPTTTFIMAMIMIMVIILIFIAVIMVFVKRLVTIMMLMIFSPLAFAGIAIPNHSISHDIDSKFWGTLLRESFFAPVFMFIMYLGLMILNSEGFKVSIFGLNNGTPYSSFFGGVISTGTIINYIVVIFIFIFALSVSEIMGVKGADGAMKTFDGMRGFVSGWVGRNTIGSLAYNTIEKSGFGTQTLKQWRQSGNFLVRGFARTATNGLVKLGEGHHHDIERDIKDTEDSLNELRDEPEKQAKLISKMLRGDGALGGVLQPYNQKVAKYVGTKMKEEELASMIKFMRDAGDNSGAQKLLSYIGRQRQKNVEEISGNKVTNFDKIKMSDEVEKLALRQQFDAKKAIEFLDDHGHKVSLKDNEAEEYLKTKGIQSQGNYMKNIAAKFSNYSEKQKTEILSTLGQEEQKVLAAALATNDGNNILMHSLEGHINNYRMLEQTLKQGMSKELVDQMSRLAYRGRNRAQLRAILSDPANAGAPGLTQLQAAYDKLNEGLSPEQIDEIATANKTFIKAKDNFTRFAAEPSDSQYIQGLIHSDSTGIDPLRRYVEIRT